MTDVAQLAGVSHMTVSRVLNDAASVRAQTRDKVLAAIKQLDYRPNNAARALVTGRTRTLGVVALDTTLYGPASMLFGIEHAARAAGYSISITSLRTPDRFSLSEAVETLRAQAVDGVIVIAPHAAAVDALAFLPASPPLVAVEGGEGPVPVVAVDQRAGARLATTHLLEQGHDTVWHVAGPADWLEAQGREEGWRHTLEQAGRPVPPVVRGDWSPRSGYELGRELAGQPGVHAIFVANDQMALGLLRALGEARVAVPGDVAVVGFDDTPESAYFSPPLSTVRQDFIEVGRRAFDLLRSGMDGGTQAARVVVQPRLVVRDSSIVRFGPQSERRL